MRNNFSPLERTISKLLSKFPIIKKYIRKYYKIFNVLIFKKKYSFKTSYKISKIDYKNTETFFGYYDKSPENEDSNFLIYHSSELPTNKHPSEKRPINIILHNNSENIDYVFSTKAYNWQQGAKTQWIDNSNFIFNDFDSKRLNYCSKIVNVDKGIITKKLDFPIYDVNQNLAITLNFDRLIKLNPDYGYRNKKQIQLPADEEDGIFLGNLKNNSLHLMHSFIDICKIDNTAYLENTEHIVNHIMISPDGDKFIFIHRYFINKIRNDSLIISDIDGKNLKCIVNSNMVSHCFWKNNNTIIGFLRDKSFGDNFYSIDVKSGKIDVIQNGELGTYGDGHPSIYNDKLVFDTYTDKSGMKRLFLFDFEDKTKIEIGEFYEPIRFYGESRCDLHPRFVGDKIYIDSVHENNRFLYVLKK